MLNRVEVENFKAWQKADITLGKITGLFGSNSAGKSSLLQLLLLLKQTRNATDRKVVLDFHSSGSSITLGSFADVVHDHNRKSKIKWTLDWNLPKPLTIMDPMSPSGQPLFTGDRLSMQCEVGLRLRRLWPYYLAYKFNDTEFRIQPRRGSGREFKLDTNSQIFHFKRTQGRAWPLPRPVKTYLFPDQVRNYYQNSVFLGDFELEYEKLMDSLYYLGPLREYPKREYHWAGSSPEDVGQRGERTIDAILAATRDKEMRTLGYRKRRKTFQEMIAHWLKELDLINEFRIDEIARGTNLYQAMVTTRGTRTVSTLTDVGFGVSQILPVLVLLYYVPEGATVLMEQPEIHLHPAVQSGLADVMLNVAKVRNVQILVESHSEHLMRRLQRRVAEGSASAEDIKLYFVNFRRGKAHISDLELNKWGAIENWPDNFFGDEMGEIAAITKASLTRQIEQSVQ